MKRHGRAAKTGFLCHEQISGANQQVPHEGQNNQRSTEAIHRQRGAIAYTANGKTLYGSALPVFPTQPPGKQDVDHRSNEHSCAGRRMLRFDVCQCRFNFPHLCRSKIPQAAGCGDQPAG
jgi:hypothetical protein